MRWTVQLEGGPRRVNHAAVAIGNKIFSFGGYCTGEDYENTRPIDVHELNTVSLRWKLLPLEVKNAPYQRYGHTAIEYNNNAFIWGGRNDGVGACNKLYRFNGATHKWDKPKVSGPIPDARDGHSACVVNRCMYVFAGYEENNDRFSNDMSFLDLKTFTWYNITPKGTPARWRDFHTATPLGDTIYIFGGRSDEAGFQWTNSEIYCSKVMAYNTVSNTWSCPAISTTTAPSGRRSHSAFVYNGSVYVFGGFNGNTGFHFNDLHRLDLDNFCWIQLNTLGKTPSARRRQCTCVIGDKVYMFGGTSPKTPDFKIVDDLTETDLVDQSDLHVLDFAPSLKTIASLVIIENKISWSCLPHDVRWDLSTMTSDNTITRTNVSNG